MTFTDKGIYTGISNEEYHQMPEVSKTTLDHVHQSPGSVIWNKAAPRDTENTKALDIGDALHALLLEPERFDEEFLCLQNKIDGRTKDGKAQLAAIEAEKGNRIVLTVEETKKLMLMKDSAMAHPDARLFLEAEGLSEPSIFWQDEDTGIYCRSRPDKAILKHNVCLDVKSTGEFNKFWRSVVDYRYYVQDAFYSDGWAKAMDTDLPQFLFLVVSTSINCGRYPVKLIDLSEAYKQIGRNEYKQDLEIYRNSLDTGEWPGIETMEAPQWLLK